MYLRWSLYPTSLLTSLVNQNNVIGLSFG